jgi:hypothetical protein
MLPLLTLHALAARHGAGFRPELLALLLSHANAEQGRSARIEQEEPEGKNDAAVARDDPTR